MSETAESDVRAARRPHDEFVISPWAVVMVATGVWVGYVLVGLDSWLAYAYRPANAGSGAAAFALYEVTWVAALVARLLLRRRRGQHVVRVGLGGTGPYVRYSGELRDWRVRAQVIAVGAFAQAALGVAEWRVGSSSAPVRVAASVALLSAAASLVNAAWLSASAALSAAGRQDRYQ